MDQLVAEHVLAAAGVGLRGQDLDGVVRRAMGTEGGLAPPDGQHELALHAELPLDFFQRIAVLHEQRFALVGQLGEIGRVHVLRRVSA